jgi:diguanylate cyclase (GGDEF)-like protein
VLHLPKDNSAFIIDTLSNEFCNGAVESRLNRAGLHETQAQLRVTLMFCSFFYLAFSITDVSVLGYGKEALVLFSGRLTVAITAGIGYMLSYRKFCTVAVTRLIASITEIVAMCAFTLVLLYRPSETPWHAMSMALMVIVIYLYIPNRLIYAAAISLAATVGFIALVLRQGRLRPSDILTMTMLLLLANVFGLVSARRYHRARREEFHSQSILANISMQDPLTGCYNRRYLQKELQESELTRAQRYKQHLSVIMCDLDHFKAVNDNHGHNIGDQVLTAFAVLLKAMTREHVDSVVRYGGEEFLVVLPDTVLDGATRLAERLRLQFQTTSISIESGEILYATASFGVASFDCSTGDSPVSLKQLILSADQQLYEAKKKGRNQVRGRQVSDVPSMTQAAR